MSCFLLGVDSVFVGLSSNKYPSRVVHGFPGSVAEQLCDRNKKGGTQLPPRALLMCDWQSLVLVWMWPNSFWLCVNGWMLTCLCKGNSGSNVPIKIALRKIKSPPQNSASMDPISDWRRIAIWWQICLIQGKYKTITPSPGYWCDFLLFIINLVLSTLGLLQACQSKLPNRWNNTS